MKSPYQTFSSRIAYENRWTRIREDKIRHPDGSEGLYGVVEREDFVVIVPYADGRLTLVEQFRYPVQARMLEFPMGMWEQKPGVDPAALAAGELKEETGLIAGTMRHAGGLFQGPGYCTQLGHIFLATDLTQGETAREVTEQDMTTRTVTIAEFERMVGDGSIREAMTVSAYGLLRIRGWL
jgi:hypothetical protein